MRLQGLLYDEDRDLNRVVNRDSGYSFKNNHEVFGKKLNWSQFWKNLRFKKQNKMHARLMAVKIKWFTASFINKDWYY